MSLDWLLVALLLLPFAARLFGGGAKPQPPTLDDADPREGDGGWAEGWSEWPAAAEGPRGRPEASRPTAVVIEPEPARADDRRPEATTVATVDRAAEHERFHHLVSKPSRETLAHPRLRLGNRAALRRAILLREVLGPPRALEPQEGERA